MAASGWRGGGGQTVRSWLTDLGQMTQTDEKWRQTAWRKERWRGAQWGHHHHRHQCHHIVLNCAGPGQTNWTGIDTFVYELTYNAIKANRKDNRWQWVVYIVKYEWRMDSTRLATAAEVDYTTERQWQQATILEKKTKHNGPRSREEWGQCGTAGHKNSTDKLQTSSRHSRHYGLVY